MRRTVRRCPPIHRAAARLPLCLAVLAAALPAACQNQKSPDDVANGDDPLAALTVTTESKRYDEMYWRAHRDSKDSAQHALYTKAVAYCVRPDVAINGAKPNCRGVMTAHALEYHPTPPRQRF